MILYHQLQVRILLFLKLHWLKRNLKVEKYFRTTDCWDGENSRPSKLQLIKQEKEKSHNLLLAAAAGDSEDIYIIKSVKFQKFTNQIIYLAPLVKHYFLKNQLTSEIFSIIMNRANSLRKKTKGDFFYVFVGLTLL